MNSTLASKISTNWEILPKENNLTNEILRASRGAHLESIMAITIDTYKLFGSIERTNISSYAEIIAHESGYAISTIKGFIATARKFHKYKSNIIKNYPFSKKGITEACSYVRNSIKSTTYKPNISDISAWLEGRDSKMDRAKKQSCRKITNAFASLRATENALSIKRIMELEKLPMEISDIDTGKVQLGLDQIT